MRVRRSRTWTPRCDDFVSVARATVDSVFALASSAEARRGLYVDVTRAREDVTIAYGKNEVQDFGDLLMRAQRDQGKVLVRDVERNVNMRIEREEEPQREERKRLRSLAFEQRQKPEIDRGQEPKIDRGRDQSRGRGDELVISDVL